MTEEERVLHILAEGKITAEEADQLLAALARDAETPLAAPEPPADLRRRFRWWGYLPLLPGLPLLVVGVLWLQSTFTSGRYLLFALAWLPFALGLWLTWVGLNNQRLTWVFVDVRPEAESGGPRRILFGFPLPLRLLGWGLRRFNARIPAHRRDAGQEILRALQTTLTHQNPLLVQVDDGGARVHVYIG